VQNYLWRIDSPELLQLLRFLYIVRLGEYAAQFDVVFKDICNNIYKDIIYVPPEQLDGLTWYPTGNVLQKEWDMYKQAFTKKGRYPELYWNKEGRNIFNLSGYCVAAVGE